MSVSRVKNNIHSELLILASLTDGTPAIAPPQEGTLLRVLRSVTRDSLLELGTDSLYRALAFGALSG